MADKTDGSNNWNEYSRLVLKELESLAKSIDFLTREIGDLKEELTILRSKEDKVSELREWKAKIDEVASPMQLKELVTRVDKQEKFQIRATTALAVTQALVALAALAFKLIN